MCKLCTKEQFINKIFQSNSRDRIGNIDENKSHRFQLSRLHFVVARSRFAKNKKNGFWLNDNWRVFYGDTLKKHESSAFREKFDVCTSRKSDECFQQKLTLCRLDNTAFNHCIFRKKIISIISNPNPNAKYIWSLDAKRPSN